MVVVVIVIVIVIVIVVVVVIVVVIVIVIVVVVAMMNTVASDVAIASGLEPKHQSKATPPPSPAGWQIVFAPAESRCMSGGGTPGAPHRGAQRSRWGRRG